MSNITNVSTQNLLSSFAGTIRTDQAKERATKETQQSQQHQDILQLSVQKTEDVADPSSSGDRDAQGQYLPDEQQQRQKQEQSPESTKAQVDKKESNQTPPFEETGHTLDLEV